jgi:shikimate dehydrogenase
MTPSDSPTLIGLIGRGIGASRSPAIHEGAASALGLSLAYRLVDFSKLGWADEDLPRAIAMLRQLGFAGCNVTYPFKQQALAFCDTLGREAELMGAVNTLVFVGGHVRGENTDWRGFSWLLNREIGDVAGARVAQVGAGGAGAATALALARSKVAEIALFDPEATRAESLAVRLAPHFPDVRFLCTPDAETAIKDRDGVVNATPVGMAAVPGTPFEPKSMSADQWLADIIYFPLETELLRHARSNGQRVANGVSMVVGQAAEAFHLLTGQVPDRDQMLNRLLTDISQEHLTQGLAA